MAKVLAYKVVLEPAAEGGYTVYVPALPGCISEGDTYQEALQNIKDAILGWIAVAREFGDEVPPGDVIVDAVEVTV